MPGTQRHRRLGADEDELLDAGEERDDLYEILYWSLWKERWAPFGPFGRTALPVGQAVRVIAEASIFWAAV